MQRPNSHATHSGEGYLAQNLIIFGIMMVLFLGGLYTLSFWSLESWESAFIPGGIGMLLFFLAFWIPQQVLPRIENRTRKN